MLTKPPANMLLTLGSECEKEHEQAISQVDFAPCPAILHQGGGMRERGALGKISIQTMVFFGTNGWQPWLQISKTLYILDCALSKKKFTLF